MRITTIGVVGCGNISLAYMRNAPLFRGVEITACADLDIEGALRIVLGALL